MMNKQLILGYTLQLADNAMILGQRLVEWCGHGPVLEQDIALSNIALDLLGQARYYYQYCAELSEDGTKEDDFPMLRDSNEFKNCLLVELPNGNWGHTIMRQFLFDQFHYLQIKSLTESSDSMLKSIADKAIKEIKYHKKFSAEWVIRLGDGTEESHQKMQDAINELYVYSEDFFTLTEEDGYAYDHGFGANLGVLSKEYYENVSTILNEATLSIPARNPLFNSGKNGRHTEYLGYILTEMQYMEKTYPKLVW